MTNRELSERNARRAREKEENAWRDGEVKEMTRHYTYNVNGIEHNYCMDCIPDLHWVDAMIEAGNITDYRETCFPCEACGEEVRAEPIQYMY